MNETIYFNGKKYDSVSEMPSNVRQLYEKISRITADENQDGVPDIVQSDIISGIKETINMIRDIGQLSQTAGFQAEQASIIRVTDAGIYVNGKHYRTPAEMPNHVQRTYQQAVENAQDGQEAIFDESWREIDRDEYFKPHDDEVLNPQFSTQIPSQRAPIEMVDSTNRFVVIAAIALLLFGCMAVIWFLLI